MSKPRQPNWFDRANTAIRQAEGSLVNLLSALAPWGAPLVPATMVYYNLIERLRFRPWIALVSASVAEILGLATVSTAMVFWQSNRKERAGYKKMPVWVTAACFGWYLAVIITVNVLLEAPWQPEQLIRIELIARALLSTLTIPAAVTISIRAVHEAAIYGVTPNATRELPVQPPATTPVAPALHGNRKAIYERLQATPHATPTQLGMQLGITRQAVSKHIEALEQAGYLARNGHEEQHP
jgi:DNA-binding transcriptional ArsR family regulator